MAKDTDEYTVLSGRLTDFVPLVNKAIVDGWVPLGAPIEISDPEMSNFEFVQALVRGRTADRLFGTPR